MEAEQFDEIIKSTDGDHNVTAIGEKIPEAVDIKRC